MRKVLAVAAGLAVWVLIVILAIVIIRQVWPAYVSAAETMAFTLSMKLARLAISAVASVAAGWVAAISSRRSLGASLAPGILLLVAFVPQHVRLWDRFPLWYHLVFLASLVPLSYLGGKLGGAAFILGSRSPRPLIRSA
jgi:hypothetical protein